MTVLDMREAWHQFSDALRDAGDVVFRDPRVDSDQLRAEGTRYLLRVLSVALLVGVEIVDPKYPRLIRLYDTYRNLANCNPDCVYLYARIDPKYRYRITGRRGTALMFEVATMDSDMLAYPKGKWLRTISEFETNPDGGLEIHLSANREGKNWVPLDEAARWMYVRQYSYDWMNEAPADLTIERVDAEYPAPRSIPEDIAHHVRRLNEWIPNWYGELARTLVGKFYSGPSDRLVFSGAAGGFQGIAYGRGYFSCNPETAVIVEFEPPAGTLYWSVQLGTHFWESLDWDVRQCSLNGHQAVLDPDGKFRAVIALTDPKIPNWLDPAGHRDGLMCCRVVRGASVPEVTLRTVPLADLRRHIHPQTPSVTATERQSVIRERLLGTQRRFRE